MTKIFDSLFDNVKEFSLYMRANDSAELRRRLLTTDKLKLWYCRFVCCRESVFNSIELMGGEDLDLNDLYITISTWLNVDRGSVASIVASAPYGNVNIMSLAREEEDDG